MIRSRLVLEKNALKLVAGEFGKQFPGKRPYIIADNTTWKVAGNEVNEEFGGCAHHVFDASEIYADDTHVAVVEGILAKNPDAIAVAVGSGTINDLCKRASFTSGGRPYMCVATAPSVDGFTSNGAAITDHGLKITLPCPAPVLVVADPVILSAAPISMISAGYGDLAAKVPAGADWLIADALGIEKVDKHVWEMVQPNLKDQLAEPKKLRERQDVVIAKVFDGLIHTGFAMQEYFDSRPASGAEHLMSHVWEMNECCMVNGVAASHGFKVAIGTLTSTAILEELLKLTASDVERQIKRAKPQTWDERVADIRALVHIPSVQDRQIEICAKKFQAGEALVKRQQAMVAGWDEIRKRIKGQIIPFKELRERFQLAGCPVEPSDIALSGQDYRYGIKVAQMMRNRYTSLDLLYEIGLLDGMIDLLCSQKAGYFHTFRIVNG